MNDSATITETARPAIHLKGVQKSFDGRTVVDVDDLTLGSNPIEGLIGPNGAGKTTLMRLIMHAIKLDTGTVSLSDPGSPNGSVVLSKTPQHRIARLGVVKTNQVIQDFPNLTIWDSLLLAVGRTRNEQPGRIFSERRVLEEHGDEIQGYLDYFSFENPNGFANSAGEKKLLDTIRCLLLNPKVLLLDEPTAGLPDHKARYGVPGCGAGGLVILVVGRCRVPAHEGYDRTSIATMFEKRVHEVGAASARPQTIQAVNEDEIAPIQDPQLLDGSRLFGL